MLWIACLLDPRFKDALLAKNIARSQSDINQAWKYFKRLFDREFEGKIKVPEEEGGGDEGDDLEGAEKAPASNAHGVTASSFFSEFSGPSVSTATTPEAPVAKKAVDEITAHMKAMPGLANMVADILQCMVERG